MKKGGRPRVLGQVKQQMIVQLGSFDERNAGFKKFKDLSLIHISEPTRPY